MGNSPPPPPSEGDKQRGHNKQMQRERQAYELKMQQMRQEQDRQRRQQENKRQERQTRERKLETERKLQLEREKAAAEKQKGQQKQAHIERLKKMEQEDKQREAERKKLENQQAQAHEAAMQKLRQAEAAKEDERKAMEQKRQFEHNKLLKKIELEKIAKQKEIAAQEQKHEEELKQMEIRAKKENVEQQREQRDESLKQLQTAIDDWEKQLTMDAGDLAQIKEKLKETTETLGVTNGTIEEFDKWGKMKEEKKTMDEAEKKYKRDDDEILATIMKTGVNEDNIGRFLKLTHRLIGDTVSTQEEANKLNAELATFGTMIGRECQDKLSIEYYFKEKNLDRYTAMLTGKNYNDLQDLECKDDEEFEEIIDTLDEEVEKQIKEWNTRHGQADGDADDGENLELLLKKYGLKKYIAAIKKAGLTGLSEIEDDTADDIIEECGMNKLWGKKLKKAFKQYKEGKWTPPERETHGADEDEKKSEKKEDVKDNYSEKDDPEPKEMMKGDKRKLKMIALNSRSWKDYEKEKSHLTKVALQRTSPLLAEFFNNMYVGVKQAQKILSYNESLNEEQKDAISVLMDSAQNNTARSIKASATIVEVDESDEKGDEIKKDDDKKPIVTDAETKDESDIKHQNDELLPDFEQRQAWKEGSECQVFSQSNKAWCDGKIIAIKQDKEGEWLDVKYNIGKDNSKLTQIGRFSGDIRDPLVMTISALNTAAVVCVSVKYSMLDKFNQSALTQRAGAIASGVEESCKQIILCQAQIRQSVMLAGSILKLKPGNLTNDAKPLWDAVDKGIIRILKCALDMTTITSQYFGFFLRFNQSFNRYVSMYEENNDVSLLVSLEHVKQDIDEFTKFKESFNKQVQELSNQAMDVITNCVKTHIGAEQFELTKGAREASLALYLEAKDTYDKKVLKLEDELQQLYVKRTHLRSKAAKLAWEEERREDSMKRNKNNIKAYRAMKIKLNSYVYK